MAQVKVYPLHENALRAYSGNTRTGWKLGHPTHGDLRVDGVYWEEDSFTYRALHDGDITTDAALGWRPDKKADLPPMLETVAAPKKPRLDAV